MDWKRAIEMELFIYLYLAVFSVIFINWMFKVRSGKISTFNIHLVMLLFAITLILFDILRHKQSPVHIVVHIAQGTIGCLVLISFINLITGASLETQEDARVWIGWTMFFILVTSVCVFWMGGPDTKKELYRFSYILVFAICTKYYEPVINKINEWRGFEENAEGKTND